MKWLTVQEFYLHPKASAALGGRKTPVLLLCLAWLVKPLFGRSLIELGAYPDSTEATGRIEAVKGRVNFERGGVA